MKCTVMLAALLGVLASAETARAEDGFIVDCEGESQSGMFAVKLSLMAHNWSDVPGEGGYSLLWDYRGDYPFHMTYIGTTTVVSETGRVFAVDLIPRGILSTLAQMGIPAFFNPSEMAGMGPFVIDLDTLQAKVASPGFSVGHSGEVVELTCIRY